MSLFEKMVINKRFNATIDAFIKPGWWIVKDSQNRKRRVASSAADIRIGQTVAVVGGQIVGKAGRDLSAKVYNV